MAHNSPTGVRTDIVTDFVDPLYPDVVWKVTREVRHRRRLRLQRWCSGPRPQQQCTATTTASSASGQASTARRFGLTRSSTFSTIGKEQRSRQVGWLSDSRLNLAPRRGLGATSGDTRRRTAPWSLTVMADGSSRSRGSELGGQERLWTTPNSSPTFGRDGDGRRRHPAKRPRVSCDMTIDGRRLRYWLLPIHTRTDVRVGGDLTLDKEQSYLEDLRSGRAGPDKAQSSHDQCGTSPVPLR